MRTCQTSDSNYDNSSDESCNSSRRGDDDEVLDNNDPFPKKKTRSPPRFRYHDFFPMYLTFFKDLGTTLPFLDFHLMGSKFLPNLSPLNFTQMVGLLSYLLKKIFVWVNFSLSIVEANDFDVASCILESLS